MNKILLFTTLFALQINVLHAANQKKLEKKLGKNLNVLVVQVKKLDRRLDKIEKLLNNKILIETVGRLDDLQSELNEIRDDVETMGYKVQSASKRNTNYFIDTDRRINELETGGVKQTIRVAPAIAPMVINPPVTQSKVIVTPVVVKPIKPEVTPVVVTPTVVRNTQSTEFKPSEREDYMESFNFLKQGRYKKSLKAFTFFLKKYPSGRYADNAQYWLAESNYVSRFFNTAILEFNKVITLYPSSPKVADARLKLGYCYYEIKKWDQAKSNLKSIIVDYPSASISHLAKRRLKRIEREGH
jgi:tol-pal system protein YbgF